MKCRNMVLCVLLIISTSVAAQSGGVVTFTGRVMSTQEALQSLRVESDPVTHQYVVYQGERALASFEKSDDAAFFLKTRRDRFLSPPVQQFDPRIGIF